MSRATDLVYCSIVNKSICLGVEIRGRKGLLDNGEGAVDGAQNVTIKSLAFLLRPLLIHYHKSGNGGSLFTSG